MQVGIWLKLKERRLLICLRKEVKKQISWISQRNDVFTGLCTYAHRGLKYQIRKFGEL